MDEKNYLVYNENFGYIQPVIWMVEEELSGYESIIFGEKTLLEVQDRAA